MSVDWITVAAQLGNFLVLVWLLKRFLYRPILDGIDARETEIAERMQAAVRARELAEATEAEYRTELAALQSRQKSVTDAARQKAETERDALLADAKDQIERERAAWTAHLEEEAQIFANKMHRAAGHVLLELTRKALIDLADETFEARMALHLAQDIETMDVGSRNSAGDPADALVTSHVALPEPSQAELKARLRQRFPDVGVRFEVNAAQAPGLCLHIGGVRLEWTVDTYIAGLDALMAEQMTKSFEERV